ncbi:MAG: hypothetical protein RIQ34_1791 [Bacteroidota bacterium]
MSINVHEVELVAIQYVTENDLGGIEFFLGLGMTVRSWRFRSPENSC